MLLAMNVGNTSTVMGLFRPAVAAGGRPAAELAASWRLTTQMNRTVDEAELLLAGLFAAKGMELAAVEGVVIASVVPPLDTMLRGAIENCFRLRPVFVEPGVKTGMPVLTDSPSEVGADRIANGVAAYERFGGPAVVVGMGTATTFDAISGKGEFLGGAIAPGLGSSAEALFAGAARLPRVDIRKPGKVIGTGTVDNMQSGLYYGFVGLVDGILERMIAELGPETTTVGTGDWARLIGSGSRYIQHVDETLTLRGLRTIYERNHERHSERHRKRAV